MIDSAVHGDLRVNEQTQHQQHQQERLQWDLGLDDLIVDNLPDDLDLDVNNIFIEDDFRNPSSPFGDIEQFLMNDDDLNQELTIPEEFLSDILVDSPPVDSDGSPGEVLNDVPQLKEALTNSGPSSSSSSSAGEEEHEGKISDKEDSPLLPVHVSHRNNTDVGHVLVTKDEDDDNDPLAKKRKRQLRNRDAAVRSRERKKMYVRDLEMKSRYFEAECKRLGMLLQGCLAENQALRFSLQNSKLFDASVTGQESAVLLLELLLLGSLLGFLGIMCLFTLPRQTQSSLESVRVGDESQLNLVLEKTRRKVSEDLETQSFLMGRRFKASRSRMRPVFVL